ncbi:MULTISPECIES: alanine/glycine:cation symporter family protein [Fusobacterium]|uniref:alanine/glycine:cation symporter family protein n=1 Tax=Fusobacterium TaxID=848 RepID=UPI001D0AAB51|nr:MULTISPECIES: alanine/glycine:cation symporter family protein [Fusobacterium]MCB8565621.1 alanine:cation symporter family protein [Fusobacterium ulcerans]MCB8650127.1 alanine:cation symporter family protein [Fusobacterium ulcerans]MDH6458871.1 AGCS family alanine or glycine:cation symporter [Fusobacterium sp. PH5-7]
MNSFESIVNFVNNIMWNKNLLVVILVVSGIIFTVKTKGVQFRLFGHMISLITEKTKKNREGISSFQAFCISTASRVGVGNLAGVVAAVSVGGPGSVFWMWIVALLSSATAFVESTIALIYREKDPQGGYRGGAPYFLTKGLNKRWLGVLFVIFALICWAGVFQIISNSVTESFNTAFGINTKTTSIVIVVLAAAVLFGRRDKIVKVLDKMVPAMAAIYLIVVIFIIVKNITLIPATLKDIFEHAFGIKQFLGGTFGTVVMQGVKRGLFSNEAGSGSAPCAAAAADIDHPVKQGLVQALGVFVDTILICSATAFVILLSRGDIPEGLGGMTLLQESFRYQVGNWGVIFTAVILFLFSFSTILGVSFYAKPNLAFLYDKPWLQEAFKVFTLVMLFVGGVRQNFLVWNLADLGLGLMTIVNLMGVYPLTYKAVESLKEYEKEYIKK